MNRPTLPDEFYIWSKEKKTFYGRVEWKVCLDLSQPRAYMTRYLKQTKAGYDTPEKPTIYHVVNGTMTDVTDDIEEGRRSRLPNHKIKV